MRTSAEILAFHVPENIISELEDISDKVKVCVKCQTEKPLKDFGIHKNNKDNHLSTCKKCLMLYIHNRKLNKSVRENRNIGRFHHWKSTFGLTQKAVEMLLNSQGNKCAICLKGVSLEAGHSDLCVDHSHITGKVRGLLCRQCNAGLGQFKDKLDNLKSAVNYLSLRGE